MRFLTLIAFVSLSAIQVRATITAPSNLHISDSNELYVDYANSRICPLWLWNDNSSNETGFTFQYSTNLTTWVAIGNCSSNLTYWPGSFCQGFDKVWYYRVRAFNGSETSDWSNTNTFVSISPPTTLSVYATDYNSVHLNWNQLSTTETGYYLHKSTNSGFAPDTPITLPADSVSYTDTNVDLATRYYYKVTAYSGLGESLPTKTVSIDPGVVPDAPTGLVAYCTGTPTTVETSFLDRSNNELGFFLDSSTNNVDWVRWQSWASNTNTSSYSYTATGLIAGRVYFLRAAGTNSLGTSAYVTNVVSIPNTPPGGVTNWYVDGGLLTGTHDGASWANAWTSLGSINWSQVGAGHTIYVSGGSSSNVYMTGIYAYSSGASNAPITIRCGTGTGHNGLVDIEGTIYLRSQHWITVDGSKAAITPQFLRGYETNINILVHHPFGSGIVYDSPLGINLRWLEVSYAGSDVTNTAALTHGIYLRDDSRVCRASEVAYCLVHNSLMDGVGGSTGQTNGYGNWAIHHNLIHDNGDDGMEVGGGGIDIYNNEIHGVDTTREHGHPDSIQIAGQSYWRIHHNILHDTRNTILYPIIYGDGANTPSALHASHWRIYDNLIYQGTNMVNNSGNFSAAVYGVASGSETVTNFWLDDVLIANNTCVDRQSLIGISKRFSVLTLTATNILLLNNLCYIMDGTTAGAGSIGVSSTNGVPDIRIDYNLLAGGQSNVAWQDTLLTMPAFIAATGYTNNFAQPFAFRDLSGFDFRPSLTNQSDVVRGTNLLAYLSDSPFINLDISGRQRPSTGPWSVGAYENPELTFLKVARVIAVSVKGR